MVVCAPFISPEAPSPPPGPAGLLIPGITPEPHAFFSGNGGAANELTGAEDRSAAFDACPSPRCRAAFCAADFVGVA